MILNKDELHLVKRPSLVNYVFQEWAEGRDVDRSIIYVSAKNAGLKDVARAEELNLQLNWNLERTHGTY